MESVEQTIRLNNLSKELRKYGFAQSSQDAISQAGAIYGQKEEAPVELQSAQLSRAQFDEVITKTQRLWIFKENTDQKIGVIADQLVKVTDKLNEMIKSISLIEMNQAVFDKKLNVLKENMGSGSAPAPRQEQRQEPRQEQKPEPRQESYSQQEHTRESSAREQEVKKLDKPIDRNGVAPESVSIMKMFYCGNK